MLVDRAPHLARSVLYTVIISTTLSIFFLIAPISYLVAYHYYIPHRTTVVPLHFDFSGRFGALDLVSISTVQHVLRNSVEYQMDVRLKLPRTSHNLNVGNFMIKTSVIEEKDALKKALKAKRKWPLTTELDNELLMTSSRPALLPHRSGVTQTMDNILLYPLYLFDWKADADSIDTVMFDSWKSPNATHLLVELDRTVNVQEAQLLFKVKWKGIRRLMHTYKLTMFIVGTWFFWGVESTAAGFVAIIVVQTFKAKSVHHHQRRLHQMQKQQQKQQQQQQLQKTLTPSEKFQQRWRYHRRLPATEVEIHDPRSLLKTPEPGIEDSQAVWEDSQAVWEQEPTPAPEDDDTVDKSTAIEDEETVGTVDMSTAITTTSSQLSDQTTTTRHRSPTTATTNITTPDLDSPTKDNDDDINDNYDDNDDKDDDNND